TQTVMLSSGFQMVGYMGLTTNSPRIPVFENPADPGAAIADSVSRTAQLFAGNTLMGVQPGIVVNTGRPVSMGGTSYNFVCGVGGRFDTSVIWAGPDGKALANGLFRWDFSKPVRFSQVTDGLSNTLIVGPRPFAGGSPPGTGYFGFWNSGWGLLNVLG